MPQINFNALASSGPQGFYQGFEQGQREKVTSEINQIKLEELKRDRDEIIQLQEKLKGLGQDPDVGRYLDAIAATGKPEYVKMAIEGRQKLKDLDAYARLGVLEPAGTPPAMPTGAPAPVNALAPAPVVSGALGSGTFDPNAPMAAAAPAVNALAPAPMAAPAAPVPVNALAPQPGADQIAPTQQRIRQLLDFARANPRMATQAMAEARILQDQLELYSKRGAGQPAVSSLARLQTERAALPPNDPRITAYDAAIAKESGYAPAAQSDVARLIAERKTLQPGDPSIPTYDAAIRKATTFAPQAVTNVNMPPQEKSFEMGLGKGQADRIITSQVAAQDAAAIIDTVKTGRDIMKSGMITGAGADFLVNLNQGLKTAGIDAGYADASANSQAFTANMAGNVGKLIKQFGAGTGLSDADREFAKDMAGGRISLDAKAINRILDINERAARNVIARHNKDVKGIKTNIPLEVGMPPESKTPAAGGGAPSSAIDYLRANPSMKSAFDAKYGAGAADRALKGQ